MENHEPLTRPELDKALRNIPMIEAEPSIKALSSSLLTGRGGSIYYGTGLTTPRSLSAGLPFDVLGMVLTAERLRRMFNLERIIHHVADTHALANAFATPSAVAERAAEVEAVMAKVAAHLQLPSLSVIRSSSFDQSDEYQAILAGISTDKGEYVQRELADVRWYQLRHQLKLKMGWIIQAAETEEGFDERLYDREYLRIFGQDMSFVYLKAGRTFDARRLKASPYIATPEEQRILLRPGEPVQAKFDQALDRWPEPKDKKLGGAVDHLNAIVRQYDRLAPEPIGAGTVLERVQRIIDRIFG